MTQTLRIVGPNLPGQAKATFHVHAAGCADLKRGWIARCRDGWTMDAESRYDGDYQSEFHFAPCVTLPLEVTA